MWVYRPAVPDSRSLPVVYFLHGGLPSGWQALPEHGMAQALDALFTSGQAAPFVLAAPDGNTVGIADPEWANSTDGRDREESFITGPLIEAVEGNHLRDRAHRAITGLSMGGYGAANVALHHPGLYGQVAALQGYYDLDDASNIFTTGYDEWWNSPDQHADAAAGQRWLVGDATGDSEPGIVGEACRMLSVLAAHGEHARAYFAPGTHGWAWLMDNLPAVARFLTGGWPAPAA